MGEVNRKQRRAHVRQQGLTWQGMRKIEANRKREAKIFAAASKLTPAQAREALARWAKSGGKEMHDGRE